MPPSTPRVTEADFSFVKCIGKGAYGKAWLVRRRADDELLVVKELDAAPSRSKFAKMTEEVRALVKVGQGHPNVVTYHNSFVSRGGRLCIVMEYCPSGDLAARIRRRRRLGLPFSEDEVLDYFAQLVLGMRHIHARGVIHRDVKSANIFIRGGGGGNGGRSILLYGDFGVSRVLESSESMATTRIGTPYYLSPEICSGRPYNSKSDMWALGCVLYELLTLSHAFDAKSLNLLAVKILRGQYPPIPATYSPALRSLVARLLSHDPARRPSCEELLCEPIVRDRMRRFVPGVGQGDDDEVALPAPPSPAPSSARSRRSASPGRRAWRDVAPPRRLDAAEAIRAYPRRHLPPRAPASGASTPRRASRDASPGAAAARPRRGRESDRRAPVAYPRGDECGPGYVVAAQPSPRAEQPAAARFVFLNETLHLPGVAASDSVAFRVESLRAFLEAAMPADELFAAYRLVRSAADGADSGHEGDRRTAKELMRAVSRRHWHVVTLVQQLVVCEDQL